MIQPLGPPFYTARGLSYLYGVFSSLEDAGRRRRSIFRRRGEPLNAS